MGLPVSEALVQEFFDWFADAFLHGELDWLDRVYIYPLAVFLTNDEIRVEKDVEDTRKFILWRRKHVFDTGCDTMRAHIHTIEPTQDNRHRVHLEFSFHKTSGQEVGRNKFCYLVEQGKDHRIWIESIEIVEIGMPFPDQSKYASLH